VIPYLALLLLLLLAFDQYDRGRQTEGRTDGQSQRHAELLIPPVR